MKTWHLGALIVVGLIVAGIAYTMYEKKKGRGGGGGGGGGAVLNNLLVNHKDRPEIPGRGVVDGLVTKETNGPVVPPDSQGDWLKKYY